MQFLKCYEKAKKQRNVELIEEDKLEVLTLKLVVNIPIYG